MSLVPRRVLGNLVLLVVTAALSLGVLELGMRAARLGRGGGKEQSEVLQYNEYDPLLGWRKTPGARVSYHRREYSVEVAINNKGLRDVERPYAPSAGSSRILALGDSFVEGYTVRADETVTAQLMRELARPGCLTEIINAGTAAYSTDQELLFFRSEGIRYQPEIVIVFFFYNYIIHNDRQLYYGRPKPIFQTTDEGIELHRYPLPRVSPPPPSGEAPGEAGSALLGFVRSRLYSGAPDLHDRLAKLGLWPPIQERGARLELRVFETRAIPDLEEAWSKTAAILRTLRDDVEASGAQLLVAYIPSRMEVHDDSWRLTQRLYGFEPGSWDRRRVAERLLALGERDGLSVLDLTTPLRDVDRGLMGRPYFDDDGHWTAIGHRAAAQAIANLLRLERWLEPCEAGSAGT